jgi:hypothetical protein
MLIQRMQCPTLDLGFNPTKILMFELAPGAGFNSVALHPYYLKLQASPAIPGKSL